MSYKKLPTKRLFYGRWPYKVETLVSGANFVRNWGLSTTLSRIASIRRDDLDKDKLIALDSLLKSFKENKSVQSRIEHDHANFFTNSLEEVDKICTTLGSSVTAVYMPQSDRELEMLRSSKQILIVDKYPYGKYTHKIYLKGNIDFQRKQSISKWIASLPTDEYRVSNYRWFHSMNWWGAPHIYFKNEKTASMLSLMVGDHIAKIEKYVLRSSINTES